MEERITPVPWDMLVPDGANHVDACRPWLDPFITSSGQYLLLSVHSFVVQTPKTLIVVDTCVGPSDDYDLPGDPGFGERLAAALPGGFDTVDVVVCTHLHFDHVGWNVYETDGRKLPRFPNARYLASDAELASGREGTWRDAEDQAVWEASVAPLLDLDVLNAVAPFHRIDPWVSLEPSPGHTPGHISVRITAEAGTVGSDSALITGDMFHTPLQFAHPEASSLPDVNKAQAIDTRRRYITELAAEPATELAAEPVKAPTLVLGTHFAPPTAGHVVRNGDTVSFVAQQQ